MTIIPEITISVRESWRASMMIAPNPVCTPVISPTTITTHAKPNPSRMPVKMDGSAAGSTTRKNCADSLHHQRDLIERNVIQRALMTNGYSRTRAADSLGISRVTLYKKMKKYGLMKARV